MKDLLLTLLMAGMPLWAHADPISSQEAATMAALWLGTGRVEVVRATNAYYVVCRHDTTGYVIVAAEENAPRRLLGFSDESRWSEEDMPPTLADWLAALEDGCPEDAGARHATQRQAGIAPEVPTKTSVAPLLTSHWHQRSPYNDLAPIITDGQVKTVAGCVAIAAAQLAYYWRRDNPASTLRDTPTYIYGGAPVEEVVPKGSPNQWELMLDQYDSNSAPEARAAAAQLCYVLGTSAYLNYANSTGGSIREAGTALYSQFHIRSTHTSKRKYEQTAWERALYQMLQKGWPVVCAGQGGSGHAFVCDGYDAKLDLFHFNFGWGGSADGYYPVDDSGIAMGGYYMGQEALLDARPEKLNIQAALTPATLDETTGEVSLTAQVTDDSTLPIRQLLLFVTDAGTVPTEAGASVWKGEGVENDNRSHEVSISFTSEDSKAGRYLTLTDENLYVLATVPFDAPTGVCAPEAARTDDQPLVFDTQGRQVTQPHTPGLYIVKDAQGVRKVMKR